MNDTLYNHLVRLARSRLTAHYEDICHHLGIDVIRGEGDVNLISEALGEIAAHEHQNGRPLLPVVVINKETNRPGRGFFNRARELGAFAGSDEDVFFAEQITAVYEYWSAVA